LHGPGKVLAGDVLHDQIQLAVVFTVVMGGGNPGMTQPSQDAGLAAKARAKYRLLRPGGQQELHRHRRLQQDMGGAIDAAGAAFAEQLFNAIFSQKQAAKARVRGTR
jgi:hypothetical protein